MPLLLSTIIIASALSLGVNALAETLTAPVRIIGTFVTLRLSHNPGIAFSMMLPPSLQTGIIASALALVVIVALRAKRDSLTSLAFGLIIGGAIGNLLDRLVDGVVTDYIAIGSFPIFNVADTCICIGAGLLLLESFAKQKK